VTPYSSPPLLRKSFLDVETSILYDLFLNVYTACGIFKKIGTGYELSYVVKKNNRYFWQIPPMGGKQFYEESTVLKKCRISQHQRGETSLQDEKLQFKRSDEDSKFLMKILRWETVTTFFPIEVILPKKIDFFETVWNAWFLLSRLVKLREFKNENLLTAYGT